MIDNEEGMRLRLAEFTIENYRGIRSAQLGGISTSPLILLTGKNGTGKSLILEALTAVWSGNINLPEFVGPYGHLLRVSIGLTLEPHEYEVVDSWRVARALAPVQRMPIHTLEARSTNRESTGTYSTQDDLLWTLQNPLFAQDHPFASIDLLSARRQVSLNTTTSVDLALVNRAVAARQRRSMYEQEIRWKSGMQMPDIGSYLTSLDYRDYVAARDGIELDDEYARIQAAFLQATGKNITLPTYNPNTTRSDILVELPGGKAHGLADLSNGERELLGLLYFVSQISTLGGVLLLDEPEKHLHPTLQLAALNAMSSIADRGQAIVVTHSAPVISSSAPASVVIVNAAWSSANNQLQRATDGDDHADLLAELGLSRRDMLQANYLLVVEGASDEKRLRMLIPEEIAGARVVIAGGRAGTLNAASALRGLRLEIPWLAVVDRDFLSPEEVESIEDSGGVFVWRARMLENVLIPSVIELGLLTPAGSPQEIQASVTEIVQGLKTAALEQFIEARLTRKMPESSTGAGELDSLDRIARSIREQRDLWEYRLTHYSALREEVQGEILAEWGDDVMSHIDGKRALAQLQHRYPVFKNVSMLVDALTVRLRESPELLPADVRRLQEAIVGMVETRPRVGADASSGWSEEVQAEISTDLTPPSPTLNVAGHDPYYYGGGK
ncbi:AAA family ATPase [Sphingomonas sp. BLCC-B65]|nr:AAA family ATPase [Sphingomonas sp. BLCC-B65]